MDNDFTDGREIGNMRETAGSKNFGGSKEG